MMRSTFLLGAGILSSCAPGSDAVDPNDLLGTCWAVDIAGSSGFTSLEHMLPPLVVLDSGPPLHGRVEMYRIVEMPGSLPSVHRYAWWKPISTDSIEMLWATHFAGWRLRMEIGGDTLRGLAEELSDAGDGGFTAAEAVRVDCDMPIPVAFRRRHPPPPEIPLRGADVALRIGAAVSPLLEPLVPYSDGSFLIRAPTTGVYAGADSVVVYLGDSIVEAIRLIYADTTARTRILDHLVSIYGPPERTHSWRSDPAGRNADWINRELWIQLHTRTDPSRLQLVIADPKENT